MESKSNELLMQKVDTLTERFTELKNDTKQGFVDNKVQFKSIDEKIEGLGNKFPTFADMKIAIKDSEDRQEKRTAMYPLVQALVFGICGLLLTAVVAGIISGVTLK